MTIEDNIKHAVQLLQTDPYNSWAVSYLVEVGRTLDNVQAGIAEAEAKMLKFPDPKPKSLDESIFEVGNGEENPRCKHGRWLEHGCERCGVAAKKRN